MAAAGVGSLAAALLIAFGMRPTLRLLIIGSALIGIALVALAISPVLLLSLPVMVLLGFATITMSATTNTLIQLQVPDALRGRVMSVYTTVCRDDAHRGPGFGCRHGRRRRDGHAGGRRGPDAAHGRCGGHAAVRRGPGGRDAGAAGAPGLTWAACWR